MMGDPTYDAIVFAIESAANAHGFPDAALVSASKPLYSKARKHAKGAAFFVFHGAFSCAIVHYAIVAVLPTATTDR